MEEFDSHTEHAHDQAHEAAHESREVWITGVALTAAILAALAAFASLLSGHHEHEAMTAQMKASDQWSFFQARSIKTLIRQDRVDDLSAAGKPVPPGLQEKIKESQEEKAAIEAKAHRFEMSSRFHDHLHMVFGGGVTIFQVAIAVAAISALTRRRQYWMVGIALGAIALGFVVAGLLVWGGAVGHRPPEPPEEQARAVEFLPMQSPAQV